MSGSNAAEAGRGGLRKSRIESLSDGVFAVALTLLVLDLTVPRPFGTVTNSLLWSKLFDLLPELLIYLLSFVVVGMFWVGQHALFHYIDRSDRFFLWINILFLLFVVLIPFSTILISTYPSLQPAAVFYGLDLFASGMLLSAVWRYARSFDLLVPGFDEHTRVLVSRRVVLGPTLAAAGVGFSFVSPYLSLAIYAAIPALYLLPGHIDEHLRRPPDRPAH